MAICMIPKFIRVLRRSGAWTPFILISAEDSKLEEHRRMTLSITIDQAYGCQINFRRPGPSKTPGHVLQNGGDDFLKRDQETMDKCKTAIGRPLEQKFNASHLQKLTMLTASTLNSAFSA